MTAERAWEVPFEVAPPPEEDECLSQLPSQIPSQSTASQMWSKAPPSWGGVRTHQSVPQHQEPYIDSGGNTWDHQLAPEAQGHQVQDLYTQELNHTEAHQPQEDFDQQDYDKYYISDPELEEGHQEYNSTGHTLEGHQVYQGQTMQGHQVYQGGGHATPGHRVYRGAGQVTQGQQIYQGMGNAAQGHSSFRVAGQVTQGHAGLQGNQGQQGEKQHLPVHLTPASSLVRGSGKPQPPAVTKKSSGPSGPGGGMLRPAGDIPNPYRSLFSQFPFFNIVQSTVFKDVFQSDRSVVVSAPTGSGKTVVMELALVRLMMTRDSQASSENPPQLARVVYMAPMKALVTERYLDWRQKLARLNLSCAEITGDTEHDDITVIKNSEVILTTPEKWDFLTRRWRDHASLMQAVSLLLIDEVHVLNDEGRGPTLEAVVSRMKTIRATRPSQGNSDASPHLRFVAVSATIPNVEDVAAWLSDDPSPAVYHKLEESLRPVKLRRVVLGYDCRESWTEFRFDLALNYRLPGVIANYSDNKPTLVFVSTRKAAQSSASTLAKEARLIRDAAHKQLLTTVANGLRDNKLRECVMCGVGFHHAGLVAGDRRQAEELFTASQLPVLVATSTLAMGVNLPAHLVVVKSTSQYVGGGYEEYSSAQLLQMTGRAGRPQFDTHATAVIMTKSKHKVKYENLVTGRTQLESHLHLHLAEHLNAEIVLGTVTDLGVAVEWLRSTFLYVRVQHNPSHYGLPKDLQQTQLEARLQEMCTKEVNALARAGVILLGEMDIKPTLPGRLMARYCVSFSTMKTFLQLTGQESLKDVVEMVSACQEFYDIKVRVAEKRVLNELNKSQTSAIRYPIKGKIKTREQKVNCLVQATLGSDNIVDPGLSQEASKIFRTGQRLTKCLSEYGASRTEYQLHLNTLLLAKCFSCRLWENSRFVTRQLERIGPAFSLAFVQSKITSFAALEATSPRDIELILNRQPPFGNRIRDQAMKLPRYEVTVEQLNQVSREKADLRVTVRLANLEALKDGSTTPTHHACRLLLGDADNKVVHHHKITDVALKARGSVSRVINVSRAQTGDALEINYISLTWGGLDVQSTYTPRYLPRPPTTMKSTNTTTNTTLKQENKSNNNTNTSNTTTTEPSVWAGIGERRACLHTCGDKRNCAHTCCKVGVSAKPSSGRGGEVPAVVEEVRKRATHLPNTPVKKLKGTAGSGSVDLSQFSYTPSQSLLMPPPAPRGRQQAFPSYHKVCRFDGDQTTAGSFAGRGLNPRPMSTQGLRRHTQGLTQGDEFLTDDVIHEFVSEADFTEEEQTDDFADMEAFLVDFEKENVLEEYEDAFSEPLEVEDIQGADVDTSWVQDHQSHPSPAAARGIRPQPRGVRPGQRPVRPQHPMASQTPRPQRPTGMQVTRGQGSQRPPGSAGRGQGLVKPPGTHTTQAKLTRWLQTGQITAPPRSQTSQPSRPVPSQSQPVMRPPQPHASQSQRCFRPAGVMASQGRQPLIPAGPVTTQTFSRPTPVTSRNVYPVRPAGPVACQNMQPLRPAGAMASQNRPTAVANHNTQPPRPRAAVSQNSQPFRPAAVGINQNMRFVRPTGAVPSQNTQSFRPMAVPSRNTQPQRSSGAMPTQNTQAFRPLGSQTGQTYRPAGPPGATTMQGYGPSPQHTNTQALQSQAQPRDAGPSQGSQQALGATFQATMALVTPSQRPLQTQAPRGPATQPSAPTRQAPQTSYQPFRPSYAPGGQVKDAGESSGWQGSQTVPCMQGEGAVQLQEGGEANQEHGGGGGWAHTSTSHGGHPYSTLPRTTDAVTPGAAGTLTASQTFGAPWQQQQQQYSASDCLWGPQGGSSLKQFSLPAAGIESSSVSEPPAAPHDAPPPPLITSTADTAFTSLESEYQSSVASSSSRGHYWSNISQLQPLSESPAGDRRAAPHARPMAGVRPLVVGGASGRKREPDPFSHLTKEWDEVQRGRGKGRLSNISLPAASPRRPERQAPPTPTPTPTPAPGGQDDEWRDLEMFQWCRRQERLALHSLYKRDHQGEAHHSPTELASKGRPAREHTLQGSRLQITYDNGSQGPVVGVGLSGVGGAQQKININLSSLDRGATTSTQGVEEPQVRGILKKPTQSSWCVPDIYEGID
ncbi:uncharacterized protein LOC126999409 [Eriocheir sinensis]|uniref:uncharacterized protein LOC126999409 n=1 Tax=Eriocheir sinensis TaxID=95602 RepID=UPI0021CA3AE2|nr:uncharacterized protein LOC126999409 [Eriocheir sinensis]